MSKAKYKRDRVNLCSEHDVCDVVDKAKEQGRKEGEKNCKVYCEKCNFEDEATICKWCHLEEIKQKQIELLEKVLKEFMSDKYDCPTIDAKALIWLEQELKKVSE